MTDHPLCHHHVEWPAPGARVAGPVVWVRGWLVAKPGWAFDAVRARADGGTHLGILGFPRADLAAHFGRDDAWLPAEFLLGMPAADGDLRLVLEAREVSGEWVGLGEFACTVAPDGSPAPQAGGELHPVTGGTRLERGPHQPFDGFLDLPETLATARHGELRVFGWLTHAGQAIRSLRATLDGHTHRLLDHGQPDDVLAKKFPGRPGIATSRFSGWVDSPAELNAPACLRLHAELADGSTHLCFARWVTPQCSDDPVPPPAAPSTTGALPALPSGRPRRLLLVLRTLREVDATGRALDVVRHLHAGGRWVARAVATEEGPARARF
jgi:O-antigen biosynthesis protein